MIQKRMKKCTGESGDIGDIAKNVKIAMQNNRILFCTKKNVLLFAYVQNLLYLCTGKK